MRMDQRYWATGLSSSPQLSCAMRSAACQASALVGADSFANGWLRKTEESTTRSPSTPRTRRWLSTTSSSAGPMAQVPRGVLAGIACRYGVRDGFLTRANVGAGVDLADDVVGQGAGVRGSALVKWSWTPCARAAATSSPTPRPASPSHLIRRRSWPTSRCDRVRHRTNWRTPSGPAPAAGVVVERLRGLSHHADMAHRPGKAWEFLRG